MTGWLNRRLGYTASLPETAAVDMADIRIREFYDEELSSVRKCLIIAEELCAVKNKMKVSRPRSNSLKHFVNDSLIQRMEDIIQETKDAGIARTRELTLSMTKTKQTELEAEYEKALPSWWKDARKS